MKYTYINQLASKKNWEKSDIIYKFIIYLKGLNVLITTAQYINIYIYAQQYNCFGSIQLIAWYVIVGCDAIQKL